MPSNNPLCLGTKQTMNNNIMNSATNKEPAGDNMVDDGKVEQKGPQPGWQT